MMGNDYQLSSGFKKSNFNTFIGRTFGLISFFVISIAAYSQNNLPDEIAKWNFNAESISMFNNEITATDESNNGYIGTFKNNAKPRTIGITTLYNVLDLGNGTGYFDMGTEIGEEIYKLNNYTVSAYFRIHESNSDLNSTGNCIWNFSNSSNVSSDKNGYIFGSLRNQNQHISPGYWATGEQYVVGNGYPAIKGAWQHIAYTQNGEIGSIYINGKLKASGTVTHLPSRALPKSGFSGTPFNWIGRSCYSGDAYLKKTLIYGFCLHRVALTGADFLNKLNVPVTIEKLDQAYADNPGYNVPGAAGIISGPNKVAPGQSSVTYNVSPIQNATSYVWTLPTGANGSSNTNTINVNFTNNAISGDITVKGRNDYGDGAISTLAIAVATAEEKEIADTAQNCIDTLILSASKVFPVILSLNPLGYGPDIIGLQIAEQGTNKEVTQFTMYVASAKDTTIYLKAGKYNLNWTDGGANIQNPKLSGDHISVSGAGWVMGEKYLGIEFKVIDMPIVCEGQVTLKASTYFTGNGNLKYKWSPTTGLNNDTIANPTAIVTNDITYTVTVTSPNGCEASVDLNLNALPLTANAGNDKTIVCGGTAQLNSVTSNYTGIGALRYKWIPSDGLSNDTIANPKAKVTQNTTYCVTVTSPSGCTATDSVNVLITPLSVNAGSNKTITCGGSALLNNLTTNYTGIGNLKYKWQPADGLNNDSIVNPIATVTDNSTYYVTVTSPDGCTATDSIKVLVLPMTLRVTNDTTVECGNSIGLFVEKEYQEGETLKYKWIPSTGLDNDSIAFPVCSATTKTTYTVTVTSSTGCVASANVTVNMLPMYQPEIGIVGVTNNNFNQIAWNKKESECIDSYLIYKESNITNVFEKIGVVPYDSMSVFVDILSNPNVKSNKYRLSTLDKNGFESTQSYAHKTMHLTINKGQNNTWNLIWEPYEGFLVATYNIYRGNNINNLNFIDATSGSSTQYTDLNAQSGDVYYQVEVISPKLINPSKTSSTNQKISESQNSISSIQVSYNSSRSNIASSFVNSVPEFYGKSLNIYPNPFKNELRIDFAENTSIQILNLTGQCVYAGNVDSNTLIDTSTFSTGIYMIKFKISNSYEYRKIIKGN